MLLLRGKVFLTPGETSDSVAIENTRIVSVGEEAPAARELKFSGLIVPAFVDAHCHFTDMGFRESWINAFGLERKRDLLDLIARAAQVTPPGEWILVAGFDESKWRDDPTYPTRRELDEVAPEHPVYVRRICGHMAVVNSRALEALPVKSRQYVDEERGILWEDAVSEAEAYFKSDEQKLADAIVRAERRALTEGVIAVGEFVSQRHIRALRRALEKRSISVRLALYAYRELAETLIDLGFWRGWSADGAVLCGVKLFMDGSIGARTAAFYDPYADDPSTRGKLLLTGDELGELVRKAERARMQVCVHAIGDRAIDEALKGLSGIARGNPLRHRIEHFEAATDDQIRRASRAGVVISMQPNFIVNWQMPGGMYERRLGRERARRLNRLRSVLESGAVLAFGSDAMPFGPLLGIYGALVHPLEEERLTPSEAIVCYTYNAAYACFLESELGRVEPGKLAALVVIDKDLLSACPEDVRKARVVAFVLGERITSSPAGASSSHTS